MKLSAIENRLDQLHEEYQEEMRRIEAAIAESRNILDTLLKELQLKPSIVDHTIGRLDHE